MSKEKEYKNGDYKKYFEVTDDKVFGFFEDYRFLSNFYRTPITINGIRYPSSEHVYMMCKSKEPLNMRDTERCLTMSCRDIKIWGSRVELDEQWEQKKYTLMDKILTYKFTQNENLRNKLISTKGKELIEANSWGDQYWGYDVNAEKGENNLGILLMKIRDNI